MQLIAPALFLGLGARIIFEKFVRPESSVRLAHVFLVGLWEGVGLHYAMMAYSMLTPVAAVAIVVTLAGDFMITQNASRGVVTLLGVALGMLTTDFLAHYFENGGLSKRESYRRRGDDPAQDRTRLSRRHRLVQFRRSVDGESRSSRRHLPTETPTITAASAQGSSTSSDTLDPYGTMSSLEREVAALRMRASLADTERRRYREEKKWAEAQGNPARAAQMKWQVERYTALVHSFHREADARLLEADRARERQRQQQRPASTGVAQSSQAQPSRSAVTVQVQPRQRKTSGGVGGLTSNVRVNVR